MTSRSDMMKKQPRSSAILDWVLLERIHKVMKEDIANGPMGFYTARTKEGKPFENVSALVDYNLAFGDKDSIIDMEVNVKLQQEIYPTVDEATIRGILEAYQAQVAPELELKACHLRRSLIAYLYFAPFASLEEKMAFLFRIADADNDQKLTKDELREVLCNFFKTSESFYPQIQKEVGKPQADMFLGQLKQVYNQDRIDLMMDNCFDVADADKDGLISDNEWTDWVKNEENLQTAFGRASKFLVTL
jgi:hypothetical protein